MEFFEQFIYSVYMHSTGRQTKVCVKPNLNISLTLLDDIIRKNCAREVYFTNCIISQLSFWFSWWLMYASSVLCLWCVVRTVLPRIKSSLIIKSNKTNTQKLNLKLYQVIFNTKRSRTVVHCTSINFKRDL